MTNKEAIKEIKKWLDGCPFEDTKEAFMLAIKALEERPQGKWINHYYPMFDVPGIECSICSKDVRGWARHMPFPNFCPNCGADMRKGGAE